MDVGGVLEASRLRHVYAVKTGTIPRHFEVFYDRLSIHRCNQRVITTMTLVFAVGLAIHVLL